MAEQRRDARGGRGAWRHWRRCLGCRCSAVVCSYEDRHSAAGSFRNRLAALEQENAEQLKAILSTVADGQLAAETLAAAAQPLSLESAKASTQPSIAVSLLPSLHHQLDAPKRRVAWTPTGPRAMISILQCHTHSMRYVE